MNTIVKKIALSEQQSQTEGQIINNNYLSLVGNIEVNCTIRIGTLKLSIADLKHLKTEQVLLLDQKTNDPIEIILNDQVIAKGELMTHDDKYAIQITEVAS